MDVNGEHGEKILILGSDFLIFSYYKRRQFQKGGCGLQEKNIIDAIKAGDEQAMQKIICRYSRLLWSIVGAVLSQVGTTEDMEECVADVFIDLWEHPQKYDESRGSLKAWLSVIARNKAIDRYRQKQRYRPFLWRKQRWRKKWA